MAEYRLKILDWLIYNYNQYNFFWSLVR